MENRGCSIINLQIKTIFWNKFHLTCLVGLHQILTPKVTHFYWLIQEILHLIGDAEKKLTKLFFCSNMGSVYIVEYLTFNIQTLKKKPLIKKLSNNFLFISKLPLKNMKPILIGIHQILTSKDTHFNLLNERMLLFH